MRIFATSDLHTDFKENRLLLARLSKSAYRRDTLLVAGDIADRLEIIAETLQLLRARFAQVFYVPGNHELWVRDGGGDSVEKLSRVLELCERLGVSTRPGAAGGWRVVPLFSWYDESFDVDGSGDSTSLEGWADRYFCKWPAGLGPVSDYFLAMNEPHVRAYPGPTISLSHFLPRRELLPPTDRLRFKGLPKVAGCLALDAQLRRLGSVVHVSGHSHINHDRVIDGVRYVQHALKYPTERRAANFTFKFIRDTAEPPHSALT
jgi:hypothetical protein